MSIYDDSDSLADQLLSVIDVPVYDNSQRIRVSEVTCSLALEHWESVRRLLRSGLLPSGVVVHRAQFEATLRSIWVFYAAADDLVVKLGATLSLDSEQAARHMPMVSQMMAHLATNAPPQAHDALLRFKNNAWSVLNSYAHAGIHPIHRHADGYPIKLLEAVLCNANGLGVLSCMQCAALSGRSGLQAELLRVASMHPACMPPPL